MNPLTLYFAGATIGQRASPEEIKIGIRNKLCSFMYPMQFTSWLEVSKGVPGKIIIDSGAFSVWNKGKTINLKEYIDYCKEAIALARENKKTIRVVNLDVIPGKKGETISLNRSVRLEDKKIIEDSAKEGYDNLCQFLKAGIVPIHVFHQGEDFKWLDKMLEKTDYIGVSPANDVHQKAKSVWMEKTFRYLNQIGSKVQTHGFAVFSLTSFLTCPWTSCDAATWRLVAGYGGIYYPRGGFSTPDYSAQPVIIAISTKRMHKDFLPMSDLTMAQLEKDGYSYDQLQSWEERAKINIRYFLGLEKWVNEVRKDKRFVCRQSIFDLGSK